MEKVKVRNFTILELIAVVVIIGILTGIIIGVFGGGADAARRAEVKTEMAQIELATRSYWLKKRIIPEDRVKVKLNLLILSDEVDDRDLWGNKYKLLGWDADREIYKIRSNGPDGIAENEDDIYSWKGN